MWYRKGVSMNKAGSKSRAKNTAKKLLKNTKLDAYMKYDLHDWIKYVSSQRLEDKRTKISKF